MGEENAFGGEAFGIRCVNRGNAIRADVTSGVVAYEHNDIWFFAHVFLSVIIGTKNALLHLHWWYNCAWQAIASLQRPDARDLALTADFAPDGI